MKLYQVLRTEATKNFAECIFLETLDGVFIESPGNGFFKHPTLNYQTLKAHLQKLQAEGFLIKETTFTARA